MGGKKGEKSIRRKPISKYGDIIWRPLASHAVMQHFKPCTSLTTWTKAQLQTSSPGRRSCLAWSSPLVQKLRTLIYINKYIYIQLYILINSYNFLYALQTCVHQLELTAMQPSGSKPVCRSGPMPLKSLMRNGLNLSHMVCHDIKGIQV